MITQITDALYEAAFISEKWPTVLASITEAAASRIFRKTRTNQQRQLVASLKSAHPIHI